MSWALIDDGISNHPKFLAAGPAASWLWLCGVTYCRRHHTNGHVPFAALGTLGVTSPRPLLRNLLKVGLWHDTEGGWLINDYEEFYQDEVGDKAKQDGHRHKKVEAGRNGGRKSGAQRRADAEAAAAFSLEAEVKQTSEAEPKQNSEAQSSPLHSDPDQSRERSEPKPHPVKDFLALHESLFVGRFQQKPPKYTGRDAKIARETVDRYGVGESGELLRLFMKSDDDFVQQAGFGLNVFQTRLTRLVMDRAPAKASQTRPVDPAKAKYGGIQVGR